MKTELVKTRQSSDEPGSHEALNQHAASAERILHLPHQRESGTGAGSEQRILQRSPAYPLQAPWLFADVQGSGDGVDVVHHTIKVFVKKSRKSFKMAG